MGLRSAAAATAMLRRAGAGAGAAAYSTETFAAPAQKVVVRRSGFIRGGLFGFLLGVSSAGAAAYVYLLDEYQQSSNSLLSGVDNLQKSTEKLKTHTGKIELLEKDLQAVPKKYATKSQVEDLRNELLKAIVSLT
ncbi:hypothetical protein BC831DRAFT_477144 [Entophlyctis helioformis]|nr:hypothetical protein BC831DRAFT_477144 [Entophlyctis helioformis]